MVVLMTEPNTRLRAVRQAMRMSRTELAKAVRDAGARTGEPNTCSEKAIQRWEAGTVPRGAYLRALETATGQSAETLGIRVDERYGLDTQALTTPGRNWLEPQPQSDAAPLNGIWVSRYEYESSGRGGWFKNAHYVLVVQIGRQVQVRSLPGTSTGGGRLFIDLSVNG